MREAVLMRTWASTFRGMRTTRRHHAVCGVAVWSAATVSALAQVPWQQVPQELPKEFFA